MSNEHTVVSDATRLAEAREAQARHDPDRPVTPEEDEAIEDREVDDDVRAHFEEMVELGAREVGEGRIP
ncbi:MAG TPA: hypothetical protein VK283_13885 [Acidimicrobiales bacterium]|nr:hypothetical protein [Acidimicrobiales bacterium]